MCFIMKKVLLKLEKHKLLYIALTVELLVGMTFIVYSLNATFSYQEKKRNIAQQYNEDMVLLNCTSANGNSAMQEISVTVEDYKAIQQFADNPIYYYLFENVSKVEEGQLSQYWHVYTDSKEFEQNVKTIWLGNEVSLQRESVEKQFPQYTIQSMPKEFQQKTFSKSMFEAAIPYSQCIIFPLEISKEAEQGELHPLLYIDFQQDSEKESCMNEILRYLEKKHGQVYQYGFSNFMDDYETSAADLMEVSRYLKVMSIIMLLILLVGFTGVVKLFMKKRERELAICYAVGAAVRQLVVELLLEVLLICGCGSILVC